MFKKENKNVEYDINYNLGIVGRIKKSVNNKFIGEYILRDKKIFYKPLYGKNVELEDTEINRLKIDIPVNLGIDPYYFLETDLSKSTITTTSDNNIEVIYNTGAITLKELIIIKDNLINRIKIFNNNILVMEANFYNFVEIGNNLFYPQKLEIIQILPDNNKKIVINYNISRILLCK